MALHYFIFDGAGPVDGEFHDNELSVIRSACWQDNPDMRILAFNPQTLVMTDVTEALAHQWWESQWNDTFDKEREGKADFCFLARFYTAEIDAFQASLLAAEIDPDYLRDLRMGL